MLLNNLQFQLSDNARDVEIWPISQLLCIRTTEGTIEFLRKKPNGSTSVMVLEGMNLNVLRPAILNNRLWQFSTGPVEPHAACIYIHRIYRRLGWTIPQRWMAADPNPVPSDLIEFETGRARDLWSLSSLEAYAVDQSKAPKMLFQFPKHAYVLTCSPTRFISILEQLKASNLQPGMPNKLSQIPNHLYPCDTVRLQLAGIDLKERDLSNQSSWEILYPPERVPGASPRIETRSIDWE